MTITTRQNIGVSDLPRWNLNGNRVTTFDGHDFIEIFYHNINYSGVFTKEDVNYSLSKNKLSLLKLVDERFILSESNAYEFLLVYKSENVILHWEQTKSIHSNTNDVGYNPLHVSESNLYFGGISVSSYNRSYLDGIPNQSIWWYAIGIYFKFNGSIPGPYTPNKSLVNEVSFSVRFVNLDQLNDFPNLIYRCYTQIKRYKINNSFTLFLILLVSQ